MHQQISHPPAPRPVTIEVDGEPQGIVVPARGGGAVSCRPAAGLPARWGAVRLRRSGTNCARRNGPQSSRGIPLTAIVRSAESASAIS